MQLRISPLTPARWPALEDLFGENGACNGCWCMYWRIGSAYRQRPREANKAAFREIAERGPPPGLLAFDGDVAVGWCQVSPRGALPWLDRTWRSSAWTTSRSSRSPVSMCARAVAGGASRPR